MDAVFIERAIAVVGAIVVGIAAVYAVKQDWKTPGLDLMVSKLLLALMAAGCIIVILRSHRHHRLGSEGILMSEEGHVQLDEHGLPVSSGFPVAVRVLASIGLVAIFIMGGLVAATAGANHVWPSLDSTKIPLSSKLPPS